MYKVKIHEKEVIFDNKETFDFLTNYGKKKMYLTRTNKNSPYAEIWFDGKNAKVHHFIAGYPLNGNMVGHLNGNSLDNRRENLKIVSRSENQYNSNRKGKYGRWVTKTKNGKFMARFNIHLGIFLTSQEAHQAALDFFNKNFKDFYLKEEYL